MADRRVRGDGLHLAVHTWGDAGRPTVLLVHGFPDTAAVWEPMAASLVGHGFAVAAHDVRGAGASDAPTDEAGSRLEHLVADLAAVMDEVSPDRPVHLVGHDWGAIQGWHAVTDPNLEHRIASYTSITGLPLDHAGRWLRDQLRGRRFLRVARQGVRSSYVAWFHVPGLHRVAGRLGGGVGRRAWARMLRRTEGIQVDARWPAPTLGRDVANGIALYRANMRSHLRRPGPPRPTAVPVQLIVPTRDRFVPEWLFEGIESVAPGAGRRRIDAGHWVVRSRAAEVAAWVAEHARHADAAARPS